MCLVRAAGNSLTLVHVLVIMSPCSKELVCRRLHALNILVRSRLIRTRVGGVEGISSGVRVMYFCVVKVQVLMTNSMPFLVPIPYWKGFKYCLKMSS